ncbi:hypothetical protein [Sphingorhabdus sp.]|jgi:hypothetical protein|uniref:hypothetical protein n=1 Tax=Sphingorhabdus sp. TaxID=1902408 RepID=UPI0037C53916
MAVLVEGISVIIRADCLQNFETWDAFKEIVPNETLCADGELVRVGFMSPDGVQAFVETLKSHGLRFNGDGPAIDIVIADQQHGFTIACDWAEFGHIDWKNDPEKPVAVARLLGSHLHQVLTPDGWIYDRSLTQEFGFIPNASKAEERDQLAAGIT